VGWLCYSAGEQAARDENKPPWPPKIQSPAESEEQLNLWASAHADVIAAKNNLDADLVRKVLVAHSRAMTAAMRDANGDILQFADGGESAATIAKISEELNVPKQVVGQILFDDQALQTK